MDYNKFEDRISDWIENSMWGMSDRWERQRLLRNSGIISIRKFEDME